MFFFYYLYYFFFSMLPFISQFNLDWGQFALRSVFKSGHQLFHTSQTRKSSPGPGPGAAPCSAQVGSPAEPRAHRPLTDFPGVSPELYLLKGRLLFTGGKFEGCGCAQNLKRGEATFSLSASGRCWIRGEARWVSCTASWPGALLQNHSGVMRRSVRCSQGATLMRDFHEGVLST